MRTRKIKPIDLTKVLAPYTLGWVAIDKNSNVVVHTKDFATICKKIKNRRDLLLIPASKNYFGFITPAHVKISLPSPQS